jgi:hypothetical protein
LVSSLVYCPRVKSKLKVWYRTPLSL